MHLRLRLTRLYLIPAIGAALLAGPVHPPGSARGTVLSLTGLFLLLVAAAGRGWASVYITSQKSGHLVRSLVTNGPYSLVRNPLYSFSLVGFVGAGLAFESVVLAGLFAIVFALTHIPTIRREERKLEEIFGDEFRAYRARVPMLFPRTFATVKAGRIELNAERLSQALRDCAAIPFAYFLALLVQWGKAAGWIPVLFTLP